MKYKLLILEDDPFISMVIKSVLSKKGFDIVGIAKSVKIALELFISEKPDLCLVDIKLKGSEDGIVFAQNLDKLQVPYFYLTAQTDPITLAEASKTKPLGYIVKPFTTASLWGSISVIWQQYLSNKNKVLTVKSDGYLYKINEEDILFLEAFDNYCYIQTNQKKILVPHTLKKIKEQLKSNCFFMPHRSYWVNSCKITNVGKRSLHLSSFDFEIPLSEARRTELLSLMKRLS